MGILPCPEIHNPPPRLLAYGSWSSSLWNHSLWQKPFPEAKKYGRLLTFCCSDAQNAKDLLPLLVRAKTWIENSLLLAFSSNPANVVGQELWVA